jgi:LysR family transcriptional regulator, hydrogen peroxide-inducible genes activator
MTLSQLEYIVAVHETGGFLTAAERSFVTQPTLSQMIKKLEDEIGVVIFDRDQKPTKPTPNGEKILEQARRILAEARRMKDVIGAFSDADAKVLQGDLRLAIIPTLAPFLLPKIVRHMQKNYPSLRLNVDELQTEAIIDGLHVDKIDLGILVTPLDDARIVEHAAFYEPFYLYFAEGEIIGEKKRISEKDLGRNRMRLLSQGHCFRSQMLQLCRRKDKNKSANSVEFESGSLQTLKLMVDEVGGYTLLPYLASHDLLSVRDRERVRPFVAPEPVREVSVVHHKHFARARAVQAVLEAVRAQLPKDLRSMQKPEHVIPID